MTLRRDQLALKRATIKPGAKRVLPLPPAMLPVRPAPMGSSHPAMQASAAHPQAPADKK